jgi:hypothetical protein
MRFYICISKFPQLSPCLMRSLHKSQKDRGDVGELGLGWRIKWIVQKHTRSVKIRLDLFSSGRVQWRTFVNMLINKESLWLGKRPLACFHLGLVIKILIFYRLVKNIIWKSACSADVCEMLETLFQRRLNFLRSRCLRENMNMVTQHQI